MLFNVRCISMPPPLYVHLLHDIIHDRKVQIAAFKRVDGFIGFRVIRVDRDV